VDEVAAAAANLPDPVVRISPRSFEMFEQAELDRPPLRIDGKAVLTVD